jgi:hypothetical protein
MAPVPRLIAVKAVLWVINTLHDPGSRYGIRLPPVSHTLATYGADAISARLLMYSWTRVRPPVMGIGESYILPVDKYSIYARRSGPCSRAKSIYGRYLCSSSRSSRSMAIHRRPAPSTHPCTIHGACSYITRVPYHVAPCKPLRPGPGLSGMDQRGVAQEKWSCDWPRPCLAYGLCMLVLPVGRSGRRPSSHDDVIGGSTWKHPKKDLFSYSRRHRHADGGSSTIVRHRHGLFRPLFRPVRHRNMVRWKGRIPSTTVVLNIRRLRKEFSSRTYHQYDGTTIHGIHRRSRLIVVWWVPWYPRPCSHSTTGPRPNIMGPRRRPMYRATVADKQRSLLGNPGNYLHAGMIPLCSIIGTMIRSPNSGGWKGRLGILGLGNLVAGLAIR